MGQRGVRRKDEHPCGGGGVGRDGGNDEFLAARSEATSGRLLVIVL